MDINNIESYENYLVDKYYGEGTAKFLRESSKQVDELNGRIKQIHSGNTLLSKEDCLKLRPLVDEVHHLKEISEGFSKIKY